MGWLLAAVLLLPVSNQASVADALVSHPLDIVLIASPTSSPPASISWISRGSARTGVELTTSSTAAGSTSSGISASRPEHDNGILHGSVGVYLTVAEWGRWNFGVMAPGSDWPVIRSTTRGFVESVPKTEYTFFHHWRRSITASDTFSRSVCTGINFEQMFDAAPPARLANRSRSAANSFRKRLYRLKNDVQAETTETTEKTKTSRRSLHALR